MFELFLFFVVVHSPRWQILFNYSTDYMKLLLHNILLKQWKNLPFTNDLRSASLAIHFLVFARLQPPLLPIVRLLLTRWHCPPTIQPEFIWMMHVTCACFPKSVLVL